MKKMFPGCVNRGSLISASAFMAGAFISASSYAGDVKVSATEDAKAEVKAWEQPKDLGSQDLFYGMGKKDKMPLPKLDTASGFYYYEFVDQEAKTPPEEADECGSGAFPKIHVLDSKGKEWKMKFIGTDSSKVHSEVAANALAHGLGFMAHEIYYAGAAAFASLDGMSGLKAVYVKGYHPPKTSGCNSKVPTRLKQDKDHPDFWQYTESTLTKKDDKKKMVGERRFHYTDADVPKSKELSALKLFQVMIANWDTHAVREDYYNNAVVYVPKSDSDGNPIKDDAGDVKYEKWFWQKDVGASFGQLEPESIRPLERIMWNFSPDKFLTRWDPGPYSRYHIVKGVDKKRGMIQFHYSVHMVPMDNLLGKKQPYFTKEEQAAFRELPIADVQWFVDSVLSKLSDKEIESAFKGAYGDPKDTDKLIAAFKSRIAELKKAVDSAK